MKTLFSIALLSFLLCATFASAPPPTHASDWVGELLDCTGNYIESHNEAMEIPDEGERAHALDVSFDNFQACNSIVNVPVAEYDFCTSAQQAYYNCATQFQGIDASFALMECQSATQYDGTCR